LAIVAFASGLIFGFGLIISQMVNPRKVLDFLDFTSGWDPSLAFVMCGAVTVAVIGFKLVRRRKAPLFAHSFQLPQSTRIDARLLGGAAIFGIGWGLVGFCPGPALTALGFGRSEAFLFVIAMIAGMVIFNRLETLSTRSGQQRSTAVTSSD
jgi:uncharacterized protein